MKNTLCQLNSVTGSQMNSYVITTADGKVIVVDGGYHEDAENLLAYLRQVTGQEIPRVDAWFFTHAHGDHMWVFNEIMAKYPDALELTKVYYNFPSAQYCMRERGYGGAILEFNALMPRFADKIEIVYTGDEYDIGDAHVEILYVPNGEIRSLINDTSVVFMLTLHGKRILFLGDAEPAEGNRLLALYKGTGKLKADIVQMAHHGQGGVTYEVYEEIAPTACLWGTPKWLWDNDAGKGFNTHVFKTVEVRGWMDKLGVTEHYVMKDGAQTVEW